MKNEVFMSLYERIITFVWESKIGLNIDINAYLISDFLEGAEPCILTQRRFTRIFCTSLSSVHLSNNLFMKVTKAYDQQEQTGIFKYTINQRNKNFKFLVTRICYQIFINVSICFYIQLSVCRLVSFIGLCFICKFNKHIAIVQRCRTSRELQR